MEKIGTQKYKTLYPDSMISRNKVSYPQTIKNLNSFLNNNFSQNSSLTYKFPIKKRPVSSLTKSSIKRSSTIVKERPDIIPEKSTIKTIKESLSNNYISYNYYDNTKGPLKSTKKSKKVLKPKIKQKNTINSINDTKTNNYNLLSYDSRPISPKSNLFNSSLSLFKINRNKRRNESVVEKRNNINLNSFSFNKFKMYKRNLSKNESIVHSPSSTRYKSAVKKNSLKLEYDSLSLTNNENKKLSRNRSTKSLISQIKSKSKLKFKNETDNCNNFSDIELDKEQRKFHQKLYLHQLLSQLNLFESANGFQINESKIRENSLMPSLFQRDIFIKEMKRASNHNDFFFKKFPFQSEKFENINSKQKKRAQSPHQNLCDEKSKYLLKNIDNLYKKLSNSQNFIKNLNYRLRTNSLKRIIDFVVPSKRTMRDTDIQFKDETLNYQRNIGKFFIYKGSGIYSDHLSSILRGDKIVKQTIKFDSI